MRTTLLSADYVEFENFDLESPTRGHTGGSVLLSQTNGDLHTLYLATRWLGMIGLAHDYRFDDPRTYLVAGLQWRDNLHRVLLTYTDISLVRVLDRAWTLGFTTAPDGNRQDGVSRSHGLFAGVPGMPDCFNIGQGRNNERQPSTYRN